MSKTASQPAPSPELQAQQAAFKKYAPAAAALPAEQVKVRGNVPLALENATTGVNAVLAERTTLRTSWPKARIDALDEVVPMGQAATFASAQADLAGAPTGVVHDLITECFESRDKLLSALDTCVKFGVLPADKVAKLREGRGPLQAAQGLVKIVVYWKENEALLANKTPATAEDLARADVLGNQLVTALKPSAAPQREDPEAKAAADTANRYWTLFVNGHYEVLKAAFELWGREFEKHVPALLSRVVKKKPKQGGTPGQTKAELKAQIKAQLKAQLKAEAEVRAEAEAEARAEAEAEAQAQAAAQTQPQTPAPAAPTTTTTPPGTTKP